MQKLLLISYYWPPAGGAGVQRWLKFVKYLSTMGFELHVFTVSNPEVPALDHSLLQEVPVSVKLIEQKIWEPFEAYRRFTGKKDNTSNAFLSEESRGKRSMAEHMALWVRANMFLPDAKCFWIRPAVRFLKHYLQAEGINTIVSTGPPHSVHLIAYKLKKILDIHWLADFRDPWTQIDYMHQLPMLSVVKMWHQKWEKRVVSAADRVVVVSPGMQKYFSALAQGVELKLSLITNGYDSALAKGVALDEAFTIVHAGSINADRTHTAFFKAVQLALQQKANLKNHLRLVWIGKLCYEARQLLEQYNLMPYVDMVGYVPYAQLASRLASARVLYLPLNNTPDATAILTGKFFEYLSAQRPIIAQAPTRGDLATLIAQTQSGYVFEFSEVEALKEQLLLRYAAYTKGNDIWQNKGVEAYSRKHLSVEMAQLLKALKK